MFSALNFLALFHNHWPISLVLVGVGLAITASVHVVLYKRDSRAAISWIGLIWLVPLGGALLYFVFGINRIRRQAVSLKGGLEDYRSNVPQPRIFPEHVNAHFPSHLGHLESLARAVDQVVNRPLVAGNRIDPLVNGEEAFPVMIEAIHQAQHCIALETYI